MAKSWQIVVNQTVEDSLKDVRDATIYKRLLLGMLQNRGRIKTGIDTSYEQRYPIDYRDAPVQTLAMNQDIEYAPQDYIIWCNQDWKAIYTSDVMHLKEYELIAKSEKTLVNRYKRRIPKAMAGLQHDIGLQIYNNSNTHADRFDGFETCMTAGACAAADIVAQPNGAYNGQPTVLGALGGTWSSGLATKPNSTIGTDWPDGNGSAAYAAHAPKIVNYSSTGWGTNKTTWESNCLRALSRTALWIRNTAGGNGTGSSLLCMLASDLLAGFKNAARASQYHLAPHQEATQLGISDVVNYEGLAVYSEHGTPASVGYVVDADDCEMLFVNDGMISHKGPYETPEGNYKWYAFALGNFRYDPRRLAKLAAIA